MDERDLALIKVDATLIQTICDNVHDDSALVIVRDAAARILESCTRVSKRSLSPSPEGPVAKRASHLRETPILIGIFQRHRRAVLVHALFYCTFE